MRYFVVVLMLVLYAASLTAQPSIPEKNLGDTVSIEDMKSYTFEDGLEVPTGCPEDGRTIGIVDNYVVDYARGGGTLTVYGPYVRTQKTYCVSRFYYRKMKLSSEQKEALKRYFKKKHKERKIYIR